MPYECGWDKHDQRCYRVDCKRTTPCDHMRIDPAGRYTSGDVARLVFGRDVTWFYAHRQRLHREDGFPQPISRIGNPQWRGAKLIAWLDRPDVPLTADAPTGPNVIDYERLCAERARKVAAKRRRA